MIDFAFHLIKESRASANLAFMRFGRILVQDSPDTLLEAHNCTILEDVFLRLCQQDCGEIKEKYSVKKKGLAKEEVGASNDGELEDIYGHERQVANRNLNKSDSKKESKSKLDWTRLQALMFKNMLNLKRNPYIVLFFLVLPVIQITLFCYSVFKSPDNLQIAVHNGESGKSNSGLSKRFLNTIDHHLLDVSEDEQIIFN